MGPGVKLGVATEPAVARPLPVLPSPLARRALPLIPHDPTPAIAPAIAPPVDPSQVRAGTDRFRCVPFNAVIFARACVDRQNAAGVQDGQRGTVGGHYRRETKLGDYFACRECAVGAAIRKAVTS